METKLNCAIRASKELVTNLHRDGLDRGCIATFSDFLILRQNFTSDENVLHRSLNSLRNVASGDTLLYDSISDITTRTFRRNADPSRPWVLIVVTDGDDNLSSMSSRQCSREIYDKFTKEDSNFMFVVGVGDRVNASKMQAVNYYLSHLLLQKIWHHLFDIRSLNCKVITLSFVLIYTSVY
jgi:hypothetical protein